jgi:hypothetical protein
MMAAGVKTDEKRNDRKEENRTGRESFILITTSPL